MKIIFVAGVAAVASSLTSAPLRAAEEIIWNVKAIESDGNHHLLD